MVKKVVILRIFAKFIAKNLEILLKCYIFTVANNIKPQANGNKKSKIEISNCH